MSPEKTTDSVRCGVWLDPMIAEAIDEARGEKTRAAFILICVAKALKIRGYTPRVKGRPQMPTDD